VEGAVPALCNGVATGTAAALLGDGDQIELAGTLMRFHLLPA
jgi:hypothetical protein